MSKLRIRIGPTVHLHEGDSLEVMKTMAENTYDAVVTDPPYGIGFMGKGWDVGVPPRSYWKEALRIAKPGAFLVAFGGTRTHHKLMTMIEDAGWELRDVLSWLYGQGFPKSHDVSKDIDRRWGTHRGKAAGVVSNNVAMSGGNYARTSKGRAEHPEAIQWEGWGTAIKPAWEPIVLARKPLEGVLADNLYYYGTGALNIDAARLPSDRIWDVTLPAGVHGEALGRWPANVVMDPKTAGALELQAPGASRFFYVAKPSRSEKEKGLESFAALGRDATRTADQASMNGGSGNPFNRGAKKVLNTHPTVKPLRLMEWLIRLVTPPRGRILDPFVGSGTTPMAAVRSWYNCDGIDFDSKHIKTAMGRIYGERAETMATVFPHYHDE